MKQVLKYLTDDHSKITESLNEMYSLLKLDTNESLERISEILNYFESYVFRVHHKREETVLYSWMINQNPKSDTALMQKIIDEHNLLEIGIKEIQSTIKSYIKGNCTQTSISILYEVNLFIIKYRKHIDSEEKFIFEIADSLKISENKLQNLLEQMRKIG